MNDRLFIPSLGQGFKFVRYRQEVISITTPFVGSGDGNDAYVHQIMCRGMRFESDVLRVISNELETFRGSIVSAFGLWLPLVLPAPFNATFRVECVSGNRADMRQPLYLSILFREAL